MSLSKQMEAYFMEEADRKVQEADRRIALLENQLKILQDIVGHRFPQSPSTP